MKKVDKMKKIKKIKHIEKSEFYKKITKKVELKG